MPTNQPDLDVRKVRDLATVAYAEAKANAAFLGQPGVGIRGMRERLRQLGGTLEIQSNGQGTIVTAHLPVTSISTTAAA